MTIEAIKEALDALEDLLYHDDEPDQRLGRAVYVLQEAVKEAEKQEPVAWVNHGENRIARATGWDGYGALYTTPPATPRHWVGLTDEEVERLAAQVWFGGASAGHERFAKLIEAKLKEKNETS